MGKLPYLKFYTGDWIKDANLRRCSPNARAVFIDLLCVMFDCEERGVMGSNGEAWTEEEVAQSIPGDTFQNLLGIQELLRNRVIRKDDQGFIFSKRMLADDQERKEWAARQAKHRTKAVPEPLDVTPMSRLSSCSDSYSCSKAEEDTTAAFLAIGFDRPQGQSAFKKVWVKHHKTSGEWITEKMEATIQECQDKSIGVPPSFFEAKHDIEKQEKTLFNQKYRSAPL